MYKTSTCARSCGRIQPVVDHHVSSIGFPIPCAQELGGPDYNRMEPKQYDADGRELPGTGGYKYFGERAGRQAMRRWRRRGRGCGRVRTTYPRLHCYHTYGKHKTGAARELPGVKELFEAAAPQAPRYARVSCL